MAIPDKNLEKRVRAFITMYPTEIIEVTDLGEGDYNLLKKLFGRDYKVEGIITVLRNGDNPLNYTLHITKRR